MTFTTRAQAAKFLAEAESGLMPQFRTRRRVKHSAADMFDLVADVEKYPEFVPLCQALRVRKRTPGEGTETLVADMTVAYKVMRETFVSRVTLDRPNLKIQVEYLDGPFSTLDNRWTFTPTGEGSLRGRVLHRLRVQEPRARHADGRDVRSRVPPFRRSLRAPRRRGLWAGKHILRAPRLGCARF